MGGLTGGKKMLGGGIVWGEKGTGLGEGGTLETSLIEKGMTGIIE